MLTAAWSICPSPLTMLPSLTRMNSSSRSSPFWLKNAICPLGIDTRGDPAVRDRGRAVASGIEISGVSECSPAKESPLLIFERRAHGTSHAKAVLSPRFDDQLLTGELAN